MFIHYMFVDIIFPLTKTIPIIFKHITTDYQTLETWIDHNATRYHNFNQLPHALPYIYLSLTWIDHNPMRCHNFNILPHGLPYISSQFSIVWDYLQSVTTLYHQIHKKLYINILF